MYTPSHSEASTQSYNSASLNEALNEAFEARRHNHFQSSLSYFNERSVRDPSVVSTESGASTPVHDSSNSIENSHKRGHYEADDEETNDEDHDQDDKRVKYDEPVRIGELPR